MLKRLAYRFSGPPAPDAGVAIRRVLLTVNSQEAGRAEVAPDAPRASFAPIDVAENQEVVFAHSDIDAAGNVGDPVEVRFIPLRDTTAPPRPDAGTPEVEEEAAA